MMTDNQALIVELEQVHNCTSIEVCDRLKDVKIKWLSTTAIDEKTITNLFEIETKSLERTVKLLKEHKEVKEVKIVVHGENKTYFTIKQSKHLATAPHLAKTGTVWISPTWTENDKDHVTMIAPSYKNLKEFIDDVSKDGYDIKIKSKRYIGEKNNVSFDVFRTTGFTQLKSASELLTDRQMEVFDIACKYGYYQEPKRIAIAEIAERLDISPSNCAELLRKAENKLLPILSEIIKVIR